HVTKCEGRAVCRWQLRHRRDDLADGLPSERRRFRTRFLGLGRLGQLVDNRLVRVPALYVVEARVGGDAEDPGAERQAWVVLMERLVRADERLLCTVRRRVGVARDPKRDVVHPASVTLDEGREGIGIAGEAPLDDLLIGARQPAASDGARGPLLSRLPRGLSGCFAYCGAPDGPHLVGTRLLPYARP